MTEEIKNNIDKLDGMTKIKGKCGYEIIGGCSDLRRLEQENKELKKEKSKLLDKILKKQCRINELLNICSTKEFILKVNGKKYSGLNGIDKAKLFINNENAVRDKYIKKLEVEIFNTQWQFVDAHKKIYKYRSALEEIKEKIKSLNKDICNNCGWHNTDNCQPNGYVCHDLIEIKNKIDEVLPEGKINE